LEIGYADNPEHLMAAKAITDAGEVCTLDHSLMDRKKLGRGDRQLFESWSRCDQVLV
jgi:hypothetical protein